MKKRKILYLFPLIGLLLSGCTVQEGFNTAKDWTSDHIFSPVADFFNGLFGKKEEQKQDEEGGDEKKTAVSIVSVTPPPTIEKDKELLPSQVTLKLKYSDKSEGTAKATKITDLDTSEEGEATGKAWYNDLSKEFTIEVVAGKVDPTHQGTLEDPFTGEDAVNLAASLEKNTPSEKSYYIKGTVTKYSESFSEAQGNISFEIDGGFTGWRLKYGSDLQKLAVQGEVGVGDIVTIYSKIQAYGDDLKPETCSGGYIYAIEKAPVDSELTGITIEGTPVTELLSGAAYDHAGLYVKAHYQNETEQCVGLLSTWSSSKETASVGDSEVRYTAEYKGHQAYLDVEVSIRDASQPAHAGTLDDPYDALDATICGVTSTPKYVRGTIQSFVGSFNAKYGNFSFFIENNFEAYRMLNGSERAKFTSENDLKVGDVVLMVGEIKSYQGQLELDGEKATGYIVAINPADVDVTGVTIDQQSFSMDVGDPDVPLSATVAPSNATNKKVKWSSSNPEVATVGQSTGVVHAVGAGETTITVTSDADPTKTDSILVSVSNTEKVLVGVAVTTMPKTTYTEGQTLDLTGMQVTLTYSEGEPKVITSGYDTNIALNHPLTKDDTELIVSYGGIPAEAIALTINDKPAHENLGGLESGSKYYIVASWNGKEYYLKNFTSNSAVNDSALVWPGDNNLPADDSNAWLFTETGADDTWTISNNDGKVLNSIADNNGLRCGESEHTWVVEEDSSNLYLRNTAYSGDSKGQYLTLFGTASSTDASNFRTYKTKDTQNENGGTPSVIRYVKAVTKTLDGITVTPPTKLSYYTDEPLSTEGMVVVAHYSWEGGAQDVTLDPSQYTVSPTSFSEAGTTPITVSFNEASDTFNVEVSVRDAELVSVVITGEAQSAYAEGDPYSHEGLVATAVYSDESELDVTASATWTSDKINATQGDKTVIWTAEYDSVTSDGFEVGVTVSQAAQEHPETYDFSQISGFSSWTNSYSVSHTVEYTDATVTFEGASRQTGTITNVPVVKNQNINVVAKLGQKITKFSATFIQWTTKTQTMTLYYSTDGGTTYTTTGQTTSSFAFSEITLPAGTNAVRVAGSSTNQIGIASFTVTFK